MGKNNCTYWLPATVITLLFIQPFVAPAADKVVVIPLLGGNKAAATTCTAPDEVESSGHCWKDRNLGASRVAVSFMDASAYGGLYQWGRLRDGHQHRNSGTSAGQSSYDDPEHNNFIIVSTGTFDWRFSPNNILWQGLGGINNPCPQGFRVPTEAELDDERASWAGNQNRAGAFASPLKLVAGGFRRYVNGAIVDAGNLGEYWSSTVSGDNSHYLHFSDSNALTPHIGRAYGFSVRCIKD